MDGSFYSDLLALAPVPTACIMQSLPFPCLCAPFHALSLPAAEVGSNNIRVRVLGDFPEVEACEFLKTVVLNPELRSAVTDEVWASIYQVWPLFKYRRPLLLTFVHSLMCNDAPVLVKDSP